MPRPTRLRSCARLGGLQVREVQISGHQSLLLDLHEVAHLAKHACDHRVVVVLGGLADPAEPERAQRAAVALRLADLATDLRQLKLRHPRSPPRRASCTGSTSLIDLPRAFATSSGRRSWRSACSAAFSMLIGFVVPSDFASTSRIPPSSSTARTPPPAITPVPGEAGRSSTRAASNRPSDSCVIVWPCFGDGEQVLLRVVDGLRDRERHLARLAVADADAVDLVADHDERGEREAPAALDDLGDAVDLDHALLQLSGLDELSCH